MGSNSDVIYTSASDNFAACPLHPSASLIRSRASSSADGSGAGMDRLLHYYFNLDYMAQSFPALLGGMLVTIEIPSPIATYCLITSQPPTSSATV